MLALGLKFRNNIMNEQLDETTFVLYAAKYYENPQCFDAQEFSEDLCRIRYIKRLLKRYKDTGELKDRLILNHIIVVYNVFGVVPSTRMLFFKIHDMYSELKPFLEFLGYMPETIINIGTTSKTIKNCDIISDKYIEEFLSKI